MSTIVSIGKENYSTKITSNNHLFVADEPTELGGRDLGPSPFDLLNAALGTCTAITLKMYVDRKGWEVEEIKITVDLKKEKQGKETFSN